MQLTKHQPSPTLFKSYTEPSKHSNTSNFAPNAQPGDRIDGISWPLVLAATVKPEPLADGGPIIRCGTPSSSPALAGRFVGSWVTHGRFCNQNRTSCPGGVLQSFRGETGSAITDKQLENHNEWWGTTTLIYKQHSQDLGPFHICLRVYYLMTIIFIMNLVQGSVAEVLYRLYC